MDISKKWLFSLAALFVMGGFFIASHVSAAVILPTDSFGLSDATDVPNWVDGGGSSSFDTYTTDGTARAGSSTPQNARMRDGGYLTKTISTSGYNAIILKYYWRGDNDGDGNSDNLKVYWKKATDSTYLLLNTHQLDGNESWSSQVSVPLPVTADNTSIDIKFLGDSNSDSEEARIDDVSLEGTAIPVTGTIHVTKATVPAANTTQFSITATGSGAITAPATRSTLATNHAEDFTVVAGTYSIAETAVTGWSEDVSNCQNLTVAAGQTVNCTITNTQKGHIIIDKVTLPAEDPQSFSFTTTGSGYSTFSLADLDAPNNQEVVPGTYVISEPLVSGWQFTSLVCTDPTSDTVIANESRQATIIVAAGETITCTFTNTKLGKIVVHKDVFAPDGTTDVSDSHSFNVAKDSGTNVPVTENAPVTYDNITPGTHTVIEDMTGENNYDFVSYSIDTNDNPTDGAQFTVPAGQTVDITVKNKQKMGSLTVTKAVDNSHGLGTKIATDFSFSVNGGLGTAFDISGSNTMSVNPGTYTVTEVDSMGYAIGYSNCTSVLVASNGTATCAITNYDLEPGKGAITVIKNLIKDNGGTASVGDFTLQITLNGDVPTTTTVTSGQVSQLLPNSYTVSEVIPEGLLTSYAQTGIACTDNGVAMDGSTITLVAGHVYVCTITNNDNAGTLHIKKTVVGSTDSPATFSFKVGDGVATAFEADGQNDVTVNAGTAYTVTEVAAADYNTTYDGCSAITIANGAEATCTITNTRKTGSLRVIKNVVTTNPDVTSASFMMHAKQGDTEVLNSPQAGSTGGTLYNGLPTGSYAISETGGPSGYAPTYSASCPAGVVMVTEGNSDTPVVCTVTNSQAVTHALTYTAGANGTTTGTTPQTVVSGASGTAVTAVANSGFHFVKWSDDSTVNPRTDINVTADISVTATFAANEVTNTTTSGGGGGGGGGGGFVISTQYTITASAGANGSISPAGIVAVNTGGGQSFSITPATGFNSVNVMVDGVSVGSVSTYTFSNINTNHTISATFQGVAGVATTNSGNPIQTIYLPIPTTAGGNLGTENTGSVNGVTDENTRSTTTENLPADTITQVGNPDNNLQPASVSGASGWSAFLNWIATNWPWLLLLLIILVLLYWWWTRNQNTTTQQ